jgi:hypothetical protein
MALLRTTLTREKLEARFAKGWIRSIDCDPGWDWILEDLDKKLSYLDFNYKLTQIKEKFGTLRFYYQAQMTKDVVLDLMDDAVRTAELYSSTTCELCGKSSMMSDTSKGVDFDRTVSLKYSNNGNSNGWLKTLCDPCAEPIGYENSKEVW